MMQRFFRRQGDVFSLLLAVFCLESLIATVVFMGYPFTMDEYGYVLQSGFFANGTISHPLAAWQKGLLSTHLVEFNGTFFSKYPFGWALVLSIGTRLGMTELVTPLISTGTIYLVYRSLHIRFGKQAALCSAALLGCNSYFLGYGASLYAQPLTLCMAALLLLVIVEWESAHSLSRIVLMGLIAGLTFLVRPLDGFCLLVSAACAITRLKPLKELREMLYLSAPFFACVLILFTFHWLQSRCFCIASYSIWNRDFRVDPPNMAQHSHISLLIADYWHSMRTYMVPLFVRKFLPYVGPVFAWLGFMGMALGFGRTERFCLCFIFLMVMLYNFHPSTGWPNYGSRYWYPCLAAFTFFVAKGISLVQDFKKPRLFSAMMIAVVVYQLVQTAGDMEAYHQRFQVVNDLRNDIASQCPSPSVVLLPKSSVQDRLWPRYVYLRDLKRNYDMSGPDYIVDNVVNQAIITYHVPGLHGCEYHYDMGSIRPQARILPLLNWDDDLRY